MTSDNFAACDWVLEQAQAFLRGELDDVDADQIRAHLAACEDCLDDYDFQTTLASVLRRCYPRARASSVLRARITAMHVVIERETF